MNKSTIFQSGVSEPDKTEEWESWSVEQKDKAIRHLSTTVCVLLAIIAYLVITGSS